MTELFTNRCRKAINCYATTTTTVLRPFFRNHPVEPVPEENFWTLWCNGKLTEADTPTIRLGATPSGLTSAHLHHHPLFYRPDALPAAQPTAGRQEGRVEKQLIATSRNQFLRVAIYTLRPRRPSTALRGDVYIA